MFSKNQVVFVAGHKTKSGQRRIYSTSIIGAISLFLVACEPLQEKPIQVTAPVIQSAPVLPEKQPLENIPDNNSAILKDEMVTDNQPESVIIPAQDNKTADDATAPIKPEEDEIEIVIVPAPIPAPAPEPDPLDPYQFIEKSQSYLSGKLGTPDFEFVQDSVTIAHYNQSACQMLAFLSDANGTLKVIHIDLRAPFVGEVFYQQACFKQLGARADEYQSN